MKNQIKIKADQFPIIINIEPDVVVEPTPHPTLEIKDWGRNQIITFFCMMLVTTLIVAYAFWVTHGEQTP